MPLHQRLQYRRLQSFKQIGYWNTYLSQMEPPIVQHGGFVDKFIGDAIMALFDSSSHSKNAHAAIDAALGMQKALRQSNQQYRHLPYHPIGTGIGIHSGQVMIGTVGSSQHMDSTAIGDTVNLASRIEGMTKVYGTFVLISDATFDNLTNPTQVAKVYRERCQR